MRAVGWNMERCAMWNDVECGLWDGMWNVVRCGIEVVWADTARYVVMQVVLCKM